jgi:hypothetical protein
MLSIAFSACKEPFVPFKDPNTLKLLVVDGFIDTGGGETTIRLTQTVDMRGPLTYRPEPDALVKIEGEDGTSIIAKTDLNGFGKFATTLNDQTQRYKLSITTQSGKKYTTDFLENKKSPKIDTIDYKKEDCRLRVVLSTKDKINNTRYYRWTFTGGFEGGDENISGVGCDLGQFSKEILVASSANLAVDNIHEFPIAFANRNCFKIRAAFKINVVQYALTEGGYNYLLSMKKNTEKTGGIFDPLPSELSGNIQCISNPSEPVIGFLSCGTVSKKVFSVTKGKIFDWAYTSNCVDL